MLRTRILTAIVFGALLVGASLALSRFALTLAFGAALGLGAYEWSAFAGLRALAGRLAYTAAIGVIAGLAGVGLAASEAFEWVMGLALLFWAGAALWIICWPQRVSRSGAALAGIAVLVPTWLAVQRFLALPGQRGRLLLLFGFALVFSADVGAYFVGRGLGHRPLAPRVSPNKTWEGVLGGCFAGLCMAALGLACFDFPAPAFLGLCVAAVLLSVIGDLTESMFKRYAGLKDSGQLLPGHGGILDRIDGITAALPLFALGLVRLGGLP
jgi:phosphatidate cytidylyltransferase